MKTTTFWQGAVVALALAVAGSIAMAALPLLVTGASAWKLTAAGLTFAYTLYLMSRSAERAGRLVMPALWLLVTAAGWSLLSPAAFALVQAGLMWLVRALYHHRGFVAAGVDLGLTAFACAAAVWALGTGSYLLTIWCFFLVQALFVWIPEPATGGHAQGPAGSADFEASRRLAAAALKRLATDR